MKTKISELCLLFGLTLIAGITIMTSFDIGTVQPSYKIDWTIPFTGFVSSSVMFLLGYFAGKGNANKPIEKKQKP